MRPIHILHLNMHIAYALQLKSTRNLPKWYNNQMLDHKLCPYFENPNSTMSLLQLETYTFVSACTNRWNHFIMSMGKPNVNTPTSPYFLETVISCFTYTIFTCMVFTLSIESGFVLLSFLILMWFLAIFSMYVWQSFMNTPLLSSMIWP